MALHPDWSDNARADIRKLDRATAMRVFDTLHRFLVNGEGDVQRLKGRDDQFRLRAGDYRVCFSPHGNLLRILWVRHRREAYR